MNKNLLIKKGNSIKMITDFANFCEAFEEWKWQLLQYIKKDESALKECRLLLHVVNNPYEAEPEKRKKYISCINKTIHYLNDMPNEIHETSALESIICNFGLYLNNMFRTEPENKATLQESILKQIEIQNEYDLQHMMYAVVKALYPSARREVNQDTGYVTVRFDIIIEEIDTVIELKCTRKEHTENKLYRELGEDGYFYNCSNLIIYVYDKLNKISDVNNFTKSLERTKKTGGKEVKVFVEQIKELV